ncbi:MAG: tetratricopeptide repeat protein [Nitrospirota bacterium]
MDILSGKQESRLICLGIISIAFTGVLLYSNVLNAPFVFDDYSSVVENESIRNISELLRNVFHNRYLTLLSFALNHAVSGLKPFSYHVINNLIHVFNALLVYYLVFLTFKTPFFRSHGDTTDTSRFFIAFSSASLFIAHPIQTQAVTYVAQRSTLIATMFYLISLIMYIKWRLVHCSLFTVHCSQTPNSKLQTRRLKPTATHYILYAISFISAIFAMKSKEIAFTLPLIIILYEFCFFNETLNWRRFFYLFPILLTILIIPLSMLKGHGENIVQDMDIHSRETVNISRADYLLTQFRVGITYLKLLVFPMNQNFDYDYPVFHSFLDPQVFLSFLCLLTIFCLGVYLFHRSRFIAFGIFWFFVTISVESSIIPIRDVINEHRLYLPSIGFFVACVAALDQIISAKKIKIGIVAGLILILSLSTYNRNRIWKDPQTLWQDVIKKAPDNARAYNNLGVVFKDRGEFDKAIEQFEKSLRANRNYTAVYYNLGDIQYRLRNYDNAVAYLKQALTGRFDEQLHMDILNKLGRTYSAMGQTEKAIETFEKAARLFPTSVSVLNNLGVQYIKTDRIDSAIEMFEKAIKIREEPYLFSNLALAYARKGDKEKGRLMYKRALELKSDE